MQGVSAGGPAPGSVVAVNQVGYRPSDDKRAFVSVDGRSFAAPALSPAETDDPDVPTATEFAVIDVAADEIVFSGELGSPLSAPDTGDTVRHADFSSVRTPGTYEVRVRGRPGRSVPFRIADDVYEGLLRDVGRLYSLKRSNVAFADPLTGLAVEAGHPQDRQAIQYADDAVDPAGTEIDVHGGWYDAGDYGKYVPPAAISLAFHLLAYDLAPGAFYPGQYALPEPLLGTDDSELPDVLGEVRFELAWLLRMQREDGAFYHKVAGSRWSPWGLTPAEDTQERFVYGCSTFGTAMAAGALAMAARIFDPFDDAFASQCLTAAESAVEFLQDHPSAFFRFADGQDAGSGPYRKDTDAAERYWASAELLRTTGEDRYASALQSDHADQIGAPAAVPTWGNARLFGHWAVRNADEASADARGRIDENILAVADMYEDRIETHGYRLAMQRDDYHWASAKVTITHGAILALAHEIEARERFRDGALDQLHYVLGRTPTGYSYVTEYGTRYPRQPHDRLVASTGTALPGMLVGGPNPNGDDEVMADYVDAANPPAARAYLDSPRSYSVNEWAIDYSAPLLFVLAWLADDE